MRAKTWPWLMQAGSSRANACFDTYRAVSGVQGTHAKHHKMGSTVCVLRCQAPEGPTELLLTTSSVLGCP